MLSSLTRCVLLLLLFINSAEAGRLLGKMKQRARDLLLQNAERPLEGVKEGRIHQQLDHFNHLDPRTFPQRFFVNEASWRRPDGPVFLFIGGEGPISELDVLAGHHADMARQLGALLLAVEHRFYGDSINPDGLETENLSDLSSQQALADLAVFHQHISSSFNLSRSSTWISFGGSYSGSLSAWFRGKFPQLVFGAVASSAPVRAQLDFSAYSKEVGLSLRNEAVGGSLKCLAAVRDAFSAVEAVMGVNAGRVAEDFGCCQSPKGPDDQIELMQNLADIIMGSVQYNEEGVLMSIAELCGVMTNQSEAHGDEMEAYRRLVQLAQIYHSSSEETCLDISHEKTVKDLMDTTLHHSGRRAARQWTYQTCTEFGFYQTCEASCPFSRTVTLRSQTQLCSTLFGISQHSLAGRVAFTNAYYGGAEPHTHRVLYVNGGVDPWKELSVVRAGGRGGEAQSVVFIEDAAHCADMARGRVTDRRSLKKARQEIEEHVVGWLKMAALERSV
ncbi:thymus-specific serine protease [Clinocottus analis]|uniref:thymus-specific serine protease n=1 Tax=Clinocottus analis TaxID=304258 RepID=UPI0035C0CE77